MGLLCAVAVFLFLRSRSARTARSRKTTSVSPYQAVSVRSRLCSCAAVFETDGKRFLTKEAPLLPLAGCDAARCECRYQRHEDRRVEGDRRGFAGLRTDLYAAAGNPERRGNRGRRREDYNGESEKDFDFKQAGWVR